MYETVQYIYADIFYCILKHSWLHPRHFSKPGEKGRDLVQKFIPRISGNSFDPPTVACEIKITKYKIIPCSVTQTSGDIWLQEKNERKRSVLHVFYCLGLVFFFSCVLPGVRIRPQQPLLVLLVLSPTKTCSASTLLFSNVPPALYDLYCGGTP